MSRNDANARLAALRAMPYEKYLGTPEWRERRKAAISWARESCQLCNSDKKPLHVHHRTHDRLGAELPADLVVLCKGCHEKIYGNTSDPETWRKWATEAIMLLLHDTTASDMVTRLTMWHDKTDPGWIEFCNKMNGKDKT